ncbi:hypothetical protein ASC66_06195 [Leifsonia sp. Root4]|jgi:uncharacterized membrane protein YidH (DUF202 family)|uniref:DUF202 domain-containing protein n=1 Tax=Leifsonia sp. Root4 TaxID=1736525 RepID=UPI0006F33A85|nr:DUF202 domain-containing protein [Leifsonia sp. Root4]KQW06130.1 hypothetical protein ASC66_06195 [Leifsonia sp. Root4]
MSSANPAARPPRDPGLQPERTALAWNRTALAVAVNGVLVLRAGMVGNAPLFLGVGAMLLLAAAGATAYSSVRKRQLLRAVGTPPTSSATALALAALVALLASGAGIASILTIR